ncbi:hypothetical protein R1flu_010871 [Riccia fluitans]|uniref:Uncharacterized protein n=1 Tax=Riccia fluitans TaxID=41844 RepID=A0ABD1Z7A0_9MARC
MCTRDHCADFFGNLLARRYRLIWRMLEVFWVESFQQYTTGLKEGFPSSESYAETSALPEHVEGLTAYPEHVSKPELRDGRFWIRRC